MSNSSSHYSSKSTTTEIVNKPRLAKRVMITATVIQLICTIMMLILAVVSILICKRVLFSGLSLIIGVIVLGFQLTTAYLMMRSGRKLCSFTTGIFCFVFSLLSSFNEIGSFMCTQSRYKTSPFCNTFCTKSDMCHWIYPNLTNANVVAVRNGESSLTIVTATETVTFSGGRIVMLTAALIFLISCSIVIATFLSSLSIGKPVYLNRKRHRRSIVVDKRRNAETANKKRRSNVQKLTKPRDDETRSYDEKRETIIRTFSQVEQRAGTVGYIEGNFVDAKPGSESGLVTLVAAEVSNKLETALIDSNNSGDTTTS